MIRILIVDDEVILRDSLKYILEEDEDIEVLDCAGNGREALAACRRNLPDIVLMDIVMPLSDGVEGTMLIKKEFPEVKIIILTTFQDNENVKNALINGADGYLLKLIKPKELIQAIKNTANNINPMHSSTLKTIIDHLDKNDKGKAVSFDLNEKESDVIRLIVDGKSNREISQILFLSEGSIKNTITAILNKLKLKDRTQLAVFAVRNNIV